jgi:hypothetical protein
MLVYSILFGCALAFTTLFLIATNSPYNIQSEAYFERMLRERKNNFSKVNGVELKPGDVLLLLPFKSDGKDGYYFSVPLYLADAAKGLQEWLKVKIDDNHWIFSLLEQMLSKDSIEQIMKAIMEKQNVKYLHVEIYLGGGWCIGGTGAGVNIRKFSPKTLELFDVYRYKFGVDEAKMIEFCREHWNKRYDTFSMSFNGFLRAFGVNVKELKTTYDDDNEMMCSEFGSRLFNFLVGYDIFEFPEHSVPDDFARCDMFESIFVDEFEY